MGSFPEWRLEIEPIAVVSAIFQLLQPSCALSFLMVHLPGSRFDFNIDVENNLLSQILTMCKALWKISALAEHFTIPL